MPDLRNGHFEPRVFVPASETKFFISPPPARRNGHFELRVFVPASETKFFISPPPARRNGHFEPRVFVPASETKFFISPPPARRNGHFEPRVLSCFFWPATLPDSFFAFAGRVPEVFLALKILSQPVRNLSLEPVWTVYPVMVVSLSINRNF